jgi:hypothetical protein
MSEGEGKRDGRSKLTPPLGLEGNTSRADLRDLPTKVIPVLGTNYVFQQVLGVTLKSLERRARNPRTQQVDSEKLLRMWYEGIVLGRADENEQPIPNSLVPFDELSAPAMNAFEAELTSFLGYTS